MEKAAIVTPDTITKYKHSTCLRLNSCEMEFVVSSLWASGSKAQNNFYFEKGLKMKTSIITSLLLSACVVLSSSNLNAQQQQQQTNQQNASQVGNTATAQPKVVKKVGFRMASWRTIHGDGTKATTDLVTTLQKIGCEVKQDNHGNHTDISFRCPSWKTVSVQNDDQSNQWHQWLVNNEFETVVLNPPATTKLPTVKIRMAAWKTVHARSAQQAQACSEFQKYYFLQKAQYLLNFCRHGFQRQNAQPYQIFDAEKLSLVCLCAKY